MTDRGYFVRIHQLYAEDRIVVLYKGRILSRGEDYLWNYTHLAEVVAEDTELHLVESGDRSCFALHAGSELANALGADDHSLRSLLLSQGEQVLSLAGKANQILDWYHSHRYCGACGAKTEIHSSERAVYCRPCERSYYPRINPCVIMLITRGREVLLARNSRYQGNFYSCLAGFIEVGENAEQTVHREIREEVGIEVSNVRYVKSQSWPFPSQLMLGFFADYQSGEIQPDGVEIEEAAWFDINDLPVHPKAGISVAGQLIEIYREQCAAG